MTDFAADNGGLTLYRDADTLNVESITVDGMNGHRHHHDR